MQGLHLLFVGLFSLCASARGDNCGYDACPKGEPDMLNVHLACHTHDDAGWLKTVDQYFWGTNQSITKDGVQYILNSVITELQHDPHKKFSFAETNFFWRWWNIQDDITRHQVQKLVYNGRLEFVNGGWVQNDEATAHYTSMIDQTTLGVRFLNETFGDCGIPRVTWQIDPFGHSREQASLFAQMGYDAVFFARLHYNDKDNRLKNKNMEMVWRGSDDLGDSSNLFTGALYDHYMPPAGFCWDIGCDDDPIMDDTRLDGYNVDQIVDKFIDYVQKQAKSFRTNHIMLTMGGDFQYMSADRWFTNLDLLIKYVNNRQAQGGKINVFYSSPTCYVKALHEAKIQWPEKKDDFFPYANDVHSYWTGFFSSRPTFKGMERNADSIFQVCKQVDAYAQLGPIAWGDVDKTAREIGIVQHHDAVSGTAKQHVTNDYAKRLHYGNIECQQVVQDGMEVLIKKTGEAPLDQYFCPWLNVTICNVTQRTASGPLFTVTAFNGMAQNRTSYVRVPVSQSALIVKDSNSMDVPTQVVKTFNTGQISDPDVAPYELIFPVKLPPVGFATYFVSSSSASAASETSFEPSSSSKKHSNKSRRRKLRDQFVLSNSMIQLTFDSDSGLMRSMKDIKTGATIPVQQRFFWYEGAKSSTEGKQASGAYIFRPTKATPFNIDQGEVKLEKVEGPLVEEIRQTFAPWVTQVVRLYKDKPYVELEWTVGPIPVADNSSKEIISRFDTAIDSGDVFYTDANGRQMIKRTRNSQATYTYNNSEPVAGNYYPVNSRIAIKDDKYQVTVLTDRSQGGSSLAGGDIELMVHRRLLEDDGFGVGEALNETRDDGKGLVARGRHWLIFSTAKDAPRLHRQLAMEMFYQPVLSFAQNSMTPDAYMAKYKTKFSGITMPLPPNVNLLTLAQWQLGPAQMLLRFEHIYQKGEDDVLSLPITISLKDLFTTFDITTLEEMTLSANSLINETSRFDWTVEKSKNFDLFENDEDDMEADPARCPDNFCKNGGTCRRRERHWACHCRKGFSGRHCEKKKPNAEARVTDLTDITLNPMEIRTFRCTINRKTNVDSNRVLSRFPSEIPQRGEKGTGAMDSGSNEIFPDRDGKGDSNDGETAALDEIFEDD